MQIQQQQESGFRYSYSSNFAHQRCGRFLCWDPSYLSKPLAVMPCSQNITLTKPPSQGYYFISHEELLLLPRNLTWIDHITRYKVASYSEQDSTNLIFAEEHDQPRIQNLNPVLSFWNAQASTASSNSNSRQLQGALKRWIALHLGPILGQMTYKF